MQSRLQYISCGKSALAQADNIKKALDNGADWIQVRWKHATFHQKLALSEGAVKICKSYQATCIINDSTDIARRVDADGVHLGLTDESISAARTTLGPNKIIGGTANTLTDVLQRIEERCDYIGLGPFRFTSNKEKLSPILRLNGYRHLFSELRKRNVDTPPIFAIGGIELADIENIRNTGAFGIAVSTLVTNQPNLIPLIKEKLK